MQSKKLVDTEEGIERMARQPVVRAIGGTIPAGVIHEDVPFEREKFDVTFECHHCHRRWIETVSTVEKTEVTSPSSSKRSGYPGEKV
jgi:hypothetical protein